MLSANAGGHDRAPDHHVDPEAALLHEIDRVPHTDHRGGHQRGKPDEIGLVRDGGLDDGFGLHVLAQIHDLKAVVAEHEADDVLADVVNIALNGGDNDDFLRFGIGFAFQQRLQACESRLPWFQRSAGAGAGSIRGAHISSPLR